MAPRRRCAHPALIKAEDTGDQTVELSWDLKLTFAATELALLSVSVRAETGPERLLELSSGAADAQAARKR